MTLRDVRARLAIELRGLSGQESAPAVTASALHLLSDEAKHFDVELRSLAPQPPAPDASPGAAAREPLPQTDVVLGLRGRFRNVVTMLVDLPRHDVLLGVRDAAFQTTGALHSGVPTLDVTVHAVLYRVRQTAKMEMSHAPSTF